MNFGTEQIFEKIEALGFDNDISASVLHGDTTYHVNQ